jgi:hypothetical protein
VNPVHRAIIDYVREHSVDENLLALTDQQLLYHMFANNRSIRLNHFGLVVMQNFFTAYIIPLPKDERIRPKHLVRLNKRETMPYYFNREQIVVFDYEFAVKLRLVGGRLSTLLDDDA